MAQAAPVKTITAIHAIMARPNAAPPAKSTGAEPAVSAAHRAYVAAVIGNKPNCIDPRMDPNDSDMEGRAEYFDRFFAAIYDAMRAVIEDTAASFPGDFKRHLDFEDVKPMFADLADTITGGIRNAAEKLGEDEDRRAS